MSVSFGDFVRRAREQAGLTQSRLAQLIGKSPTTIRSWEHGRTNPADPGAVSAMAAVLGLDETELLGQAGFEESGTPTALSGRQELSSLASERDIMFLPVVTEPSGPVMTDLPEPESEESALADDPIAVAAPAETEPITITISPERVPAPAAAAAEPALDEPIRETPGPRTKIVVTHQSATGASLGSSNGYVGALSYVEDEAEKDFYRRRGVITALVLVFMVIVVWWGLGRTGGAIGDLIDAIVGSLDF
jgi:transcriptional regulator with XRE-family HTH domain